VQSREDQVHADVAPEHVDEAEDAEPRGHQGSVLAGGDLMFLKCEYIVKLSDFGIRHSDVPKEVSDTVKLVQMLRLSTQRQVPTKSDARDADNQEKPEYTTVLLGLPRMP
jgi:hypothetical protein